MQGEYTVTLLVSGPEGTNGLTRTDCVTVYEPVSASFVASPTVGAPPLTVTFTNLSTGDYENSLWSFGDGMTSTLENPTHTYMVTGIYTVTLVAGGFGGTDTEVRAEYINVQPDERSIYLPIILHHW
ncbi:MAG: PKD domain-containing protein [Anaerolineae bacterium]|nr:PKD domain-containing protein [Anaerolineae bacterium]